MRRIGRVAIKSETSKQISLEEKLGRQCFHDIAKEPLEPITKTVTKTSGKLLGESTVTTKAIEEKNESNVHVEAFELMSNNAVFDTGFIRGFANLIVREIKSHV